MSPRGDPRARRATQPGPVDRYRPTVVEAPNTFVAGEESALVRRIEGGPALPRDRTVVTAISGVRGRPTLVNNVETLAHIALIARFGPHWFRSRGRPGRPRQHARHTVGRVTKRGVVEVPTGALLADLIERCGATDPTTVRAVLLGGYHGRWMPASAFRHAHPVLGRRGIVHALGRHECGLARTAAIADYLADQSARQCGPCRIGLPRLAHLLDELAHDRVDNTCIREIRRLVDLVDGRGACRHPDGTARMIRSALDTFADDIEHHRTGAANRVSEIMSPTTELRGQHERRENSSRGCTSTGRDATDVACAPNCCPGCCAATPGATRLPVTARANRDTATGARRRPRRRRPMPPTRPVPHRA